MRKKVYVARFEFREKYWTDVYEEEFDTLREAKRCAESYSIGDHYLASGGPDNVITKIEVDQYYVDDDDWDD